MRGLRNVALFSSTLALFVLRCHICTFWSIKVNEKLNNFTCQIGRLPPRSSLHFESRYSFQCRSPRFPPAGSGKDPCTKQELRMGLSVSCNACVCDASRISQRSSKIKAHFQHSDWEIPDSTTHWTITAVGTSTHINWYVLVRRWFSLSC